MALQKQVIPVEFKTGLNDKVADQLMVGEFDVLENCIRKKYGRIDKRTGYSALGTALVGGGTVGLGKKIDVYNESEVLLFDGQQAYSYSTTSEQWINRGVVTSLTTDTYPIVSNNATQYSQDGASNNGINAFIYNDIRNNVNTIRVSVYQGRAPLVIDQILDTATLPGPSRAIALGPYIYFLWRNGTNLAVSRVSIANPTVIESISSGLVTDMSTSAFQWDIDVYDPMASAILTYCTGGNTTKVAYFLVNGAIGTTASGYPNTLTISENSSLFLTIKCDAIRSRLWLVYAKNVNTAQSSRVYGLTSDFLVNSSANIESFTFLTPPYPITATCAITADGLLTMLFTTVASANTNFNRARKAVATWPIGGSISITTAAVYIALGVNLVSQAFVADDRVYIWCEMESTLQSTHFLIRASDGEVVAREFVGTAANGGTSSGTGYTGTLPSVFIDDSGKYLAPLQVITRLNQLDGSTQSTWRNLTAVEMNFDATDIRGVTLGNVYHVQGAIPKVFDGQTFVEENFNAYPEVTASSATTGGSLVSSSEYFYAAIYEWVDAQGNIVRSAPSIPSVTTLGGSDTAISVTLTTLKLTDKLSTRSTVNIVVYRGVSNQDAVLYRDVVIANDPTVDTLTVTLISADTTVDTHEILYTTGGVLENLPSPPASYVTIYKNRIVLAGLEDPNQIAYSKQYQPGEAVAFNDGFRLQVDPTGGPITAVGAMDDKLIIFKRGRVFGLTGDGPLDTGAQNDFAAPILISTDVGCNSADSIVLTPNGLMFKSDKGLRLLNRNLGVDPVGEEVDDSKGLTVTGAVLLGDEEQVRFSTSDGAMLVYNYRFNEWSTYAGYKAFSCVRLVNDFYHLTTSGLVMKDNTDYLDNGARYSMAIETSWFSFAGLQGYQRIYRLACLGDFISDHYTRIKLAYDYENDFRETIYFNVDDGLDLTYYGDDPVYGDSKVYGGGVSGNASGVYQFSTKPRKQKCGALKLRIEDIDTKTPAGGGSFNFVSISFEVGVVSPSINKLNGSKRIGSL